MGINRKYNVFKQTRAVIELLTEGLKFFKINPFFFKTSPMYNLIMYAHIATVVPCIFLGAFALFYKKRNKLHKQIGKIYCVLMMLTSIFALFLPAHVGPRLFNHFGFIHGFCFLTLYSVPTAIIAIKKGNVKKHKQKLIGLYIGAIVIAGSFTFFPGRFMHQLFFG